MSFSSLQTRNNGERVTDDWFNSIKTAVEELQDMFGAGSVQEQEFTIVNNTGPSDVTNLLFSGASYYGALVDYVVYRNTDDYEYSRCGTLSLTYKPVAATWELSDSGAGDDDVTFSCTSAGQVQYTSSDMSGANYSGKMIFKARTVSAPA